MEVEARAGAEPHGSVIECFNTQAFQEERKQLGYWEITHQAVFS